MATTIKPADRKAMQTATMACWWHSRAFPKDGPEWTGIRNELEVLALHAERRDDMAEAHEYARLARIANDAARAQYVNADPAYRSPGAKLLRNVVFDQINRA